MAKLFDRTTLVLVRTIPEIEMWFAAWAPRFFVVF
jgi:hypothetical protein